MIAVTSFIASLPKVASVMNRAVPIVVIMSGSCQIHNELRFDPDGRVGTTVFGVRAMV